MHQKKRLTLAEFNTLKPYLSKRANVAALSAVMVDGKSQAEVARQENVTRKAISQAVGKLWKLHIQHGMRPEGWVIVSVALPKELAEVVNDMARNARAKLGKGKEPNENTGDR